MPGLDDVLERLVNDAGFRGRLAADPAGALAGYDLTSEDLALLASQVTDGAGASGAVEARTSRASLVGFMSAFGDVAEALSPATDLGAGGSVPPAADAIPTETISMNFDKVTYQHEATGGPDVLNIYPGAGGDAQAPQEETYLKVELVNVQAVGDPQATADLAVSGDDPDVSGDFDGDGDVDGRDFLAWQRQLGQDAAGPDALATPEGGGAEPTGPIADVLYSAGGNSAPETPGLDPGIAGPAGHYVSQDGGATSAEGSPPIAVDETSFEYPGAYGSAGSDPIDSPASGGRVPLSGDPDGDTGSADGWVNVGQTEQFLFDNTDIAEPGSGGDALAAAPADPPGASDAFAWDPGDGTDAGATGEQIDLPQLTIQHEVDHASPGRGTAGTAGWVPVVGDWDGDAANASGDSDGRDFLAWQRQFGQDAEVGAVALSVGDEGNESAEADATGGLPQPAELGLEESAEIEPLAVKLENVQITSYQLGVLDNDAAPDDKAVDLSPDSPDSASRT